MASSQASVHCRPMRMRYLCTILPQAPTSPMTPHPCGPQRRLMSNTVTSARCRPALRHSCRVTLESILSILHLTSTQHHLTQGRMRVLGHTRCRHSHPVRCTGCNRSTWPSPTAAAPPVFFIPTQLKAHVITARVHLVHHHHHALTPFRATRPSTCVWAWVGSAVPLPILPMHQIKVWAPMNCWKNSRTSVCL